jgi:hypothetical protein
LNLTEKIALGTANFEDITPAAAGSLSTRLAFDKDLATFWKVHIELVSRRNSADAFRI